jgi:hypothetical protein
VTPNELIEPMPCKLCRVYPRAALIGETDSAQGPVRLIARLTCGCRSFYTTAAIGEFGEAENEIARAWNARQEGITS